MKQIKRQTILKLMQANREAFGYFIKDKRRNKGMSQEELAQEMGATREVISRIENNNPSAPKDLLDYLENFCNVLGLSELEQIELYGLAGYEYPYPQHQYPQQPDEQFLTEFLTQHDFPAFVITPLADYIGFNAYYGELYGYLDRLKLLIEHQFSNNILYLFFETEKFNTKLYRGGEEAWQNQLYITLRSFRLISHYYRSYPRYRKLLDYLQIEYPAFEVWWKESQTRTLRHQDLLSSGNITICHPNFDMSIKFWSMRYPYQYTRSDYIYGVYMPYGENSFENYIRYKNWVDEKLLNTNSSKICRFDVR